MNSQTPDTLRRRRNAQAARVARVLPSPLPPPPPVQTPSTHAAADKRFDLWLVRGASLSQVILSAATIFGFWFTVIPLYQKAALDEQLAKVDSDLKIAQTSVASAKREAYEQHRVNFATRLSFNASNHCSDTLRFIMQPTGALDFQNFKARKAERHATALELEVDVKQCLAEELVKAKSAEVLNATDQAFLSQLLNELGDKLNAQRLEAKRQISDFPLKATFPDTVLDPPGSATAYVYQRQDEAAKLLHMTIPAVKLQEGRHDAIELTQERIAADYRQKCFGAILDVLRPVKWPDLKSTSATPQPAAASK